MVTEGSHLTHDNTFIAMEMPVRNKEIAAAEKDKAYWVSMAMIEHYVEQSGWVKGSQG